MQVTLNKKRDTYDVINEYKKRIDINNYTQRKIIQMDFKLVFLLVFLLLFIYKHKYAYVYKKQRKKKL